MARKKQQQIIENAEVTDAGSKGKNIARAGSFVILVDNAVPGDIVDIRLYKKKKGLGMGKAVKFHELSKRRIEPVCSHFEFCGGCSWQNMDYQSQLHFKQKAVSDAFTRIGKLEIPDISPIIGSERTEYYRNRLDYAFSDRRWMSFEEMDARGGLKEEPGLGFHVSGRYDKVLDLHRCYLQADPSNPIRLAVRQYAIDNNYPFFNIIGQGGSLRSLVVRTTTTGELMVVVIFFKEEEERILQLLDFIKLQFPAITSLYYVRNPKANDTVFDLDHHLYSGREYIIETIHGVNYRIGPKSFFQTNPFQARQLFARTMEMASLTGQENVYDLYTGAGAIALQAAGKAKKVTGIETVPEAIEFARLNAADNGIENVRFYASDVKDLFNDEFIAEHGRPDLIITDPPRVGMDKLVVKKLLEVKAPRIVYVSCNPATQARDLELMKEVYSIKAIQPVDMFPHTYHVENIVLLELR